MWNGELEDGWIVSAAVYEIQLYNNGKNDNIYKGIISKERKVNFCLQCII